MASAEQVCIQWPLAKMEQLVAYVSKVADEGARNLAHFTVRDIGVNDRNELQVCLHTLALPVRQLTPC